MLKPLYSNHLHTNTSYLAFFSRQLFNLSSVPTAPKWNQLTIWLLLSNIQGVRCPYTLFFLIAKQRAKLVRKPVSQQESNRRAVH